eukprot:TRINITY_DN7662_c0_g1_i1.p1 TRINITY_DN7662_c0_g1~~TRINITY_DN7662_c0_g1_i1.p1  ORF type:complete len:245 (+),score=38.80 TRINITY_DN7662_c0_g1_i1:79-735(+)
MAGWRVECINGNVSEVYSFPMNFELAHQETVGIYWGQKNEYYKKQQGKPILWWDKKDYPFSKEFQVRLINSRNEVEADSKLSVASIHPSVPDIYGVTTSDNSPITLYLDPDVGIIRVTNSSNKTQDFSDCRIIVTSGSRDQKSTYHFRTGYFLTAKDTVVISWGKEYSGRKDTNNQLYWAESHVWDVHNTSRIKAELLNKKGHVVAFASLGFGQNPLV